MTIAEAIAAISAATGKSEAESRDALLEELRGLKASPPQPANVNPSAMQAAYDAARNGQAASEPTPDGE